MKDYKRLTRFDKFSNSYWAKGTHQEIIDRLGELEDKIENGRLVDCIWFISWLNEQVCCGQVIGYEEDSGFVILTNGSMISADKIWTNCEDAEKELLKRKIKQLDEEEYQELKAEEIYNAGYHKINKDFADKLKKKFGNSCSEYYPLLLELTSEQLDETLKEFIKD